MYLSNKILNFQTTISNKKSEASGEALQPDLINNKSRDSTSNTSPSSRSSSNSSTSYSSSSSSASDSEIVSNNQANVDQAPSTSKSAGENSYRTDSRLSKRRKTYHQSPINSNESDVDLSDEDPTFIHRSRSRIRKNNSSSESSSSSSSESEPNPAVSRTNTNNPSNMNKRSRKRDPSKWKQNVTKSLRNSGKAYVSLSNKKQIPARCIKDVCNNCRLKCPERVNEANRNTLFESYWSLGEIELQRSYIRSCMIEVRPKYTYSNAATPRLPNHAFYFTLDNNKLRVCKTFL